MIRWLYLIIVLIVFVSCVSEKKHIKKEPLMYEASEMALLMRQMYEYNKVLKENIISRDSLIKLPSNFLNIHSAKLTDATDRDSSFEILSRKYLKFQNSIYLEEDSSKVRFNRTISLCIECHKTRCDGPIPKIKKLLIN